MEPPSFPANGLFTVRAAPGSDATLVLPVPTGSPPFNYQWSRAGASLDERFRATDDAGGVRLTVSAARTGDTNVYTLQASNAAGSDTSRVRLEVSADEAPTGEDPPTFLRRLQDLTVKVGTRTRFLVEIVSSTECKVTWFRNERRLLEAERVALARDGNFWCADVAAVSVDDAGRWTCTAENAGGRASCSAHLNVLVPKAYKRPEFVEELRALLTEQGTVSLECKVVGVPTPVLRWFKDSREIKAGDVFALTANADDPTSLGTYTCEAVNCMGRAYSSSKVHVVGRGSREGSLRPSSSLAPEPPPIFTKELEDQFVRICEPLTLGCHIVVPPWPRSVVWYNKEGKVEPSERYHVLEDGAGGYLLEVPSAEWPDEGEWKCVATSSGGRIGISTCYVTMDVPKNYRKPRFMENLQAVLTEEGLVSFECKVVGFPTPVLSWFKDGQELKPGDVYQLTGTNSLGSYCCIARNCMGQASSSAELTVEDIQNQLNEEEKLQLFSKNQAPKFIQGLKSIEAKIDEPFRFTVKVAIPPEPSVLWYRDDQPVDESSRCHHGREDRGVFYLDIQSLEFLDQAEWKCVAMNDFGHSVTSCFLKLIIPRHYKKPRFLENLQAILSDEGAVNLECKVIGVPQPVLKWYKDGEELKPGDIHRIISGQDGTCCLGTYTCEAQNCMGIAASSASLLGFDDSMKAKKKKAEEQALQRNLSLSTIHEERTSQMYDTPVGDVTTLDDKGEISFSFDGKEVSVSLYETPDLTEEEALQIVEMYADQLSENITEHNVVELPPLRFVKETSTSGNLLMEAVIIDVSPEYFVSPDEDMRTEADIDDISIADENGPPQLSLDQDIEIGGEDYLEKTMALLSEEKSDLSLKFGRKKSDSQRSADDFFSLSRDQSLSEDKKDDDTQAISDLQSFASAHSSGKPKSKSSKPSGEDGQESSEPTKTILLKDEAMKHSLDAEPSPVVKPKRERRTSRSSRRSSSGSEKSEKSVSKSREVVRKKESIEIEVPMKPKLTDEEFKNKMINISASLSKVINDVQIIERDIILKSELMSSAATASRSLEIISSLISPLSEIHSITDAAKESVSESKEVSSTLFNSLPQPLKTLQQSLTIIEKCIDMESDSKTLVKKTCVAFIETCGSEVQKLITDINSVTATDYLLTEDKILKEIESLNNEMNTVIKFSADTIKARNLLSEASEIKVDEPSQEVKHLRDTQKAVFELKSPLMSLLCIAESADSGKIVDIAKVRNSEVILNDMSASIQDLQTALEQIETLSVKESTTSLHKYNTEIIETVMESVVKLRSSFEQLSTESEGEDKAVLKQAVASITENLNKISSQIEVVENKIGTFDILQSENKLDALQKMAQILIALENNLPKLESMPEVKNHMTVFHKNLTKVLENVIESNESKKYFSLMEICDAVNRINASIKNLDADNILPLASLNNTLRIIQDQFITNVFDSELNCALLSNIADTLVGIQECINTAEETSIQIDSDHVQDIASHKYDETKAKVVIEHIDHAIAAIENVKAIESTQDLKISIAPTLESICPVLEELRRSVASTKANGVNEEHISDISDISSFAQTFATPLCELNQNLIVLNQQIIENIENLKQNSEIVSTIAEPLHELHTTLEILQQDVISQYGEDVVPYDISVNMASAVQNLQSCIVMIQEQAGVEAVDEMSTLEDISGIKTTAETIASDRLVLPATEETAVGQTILPFNQELQTTATAQALQTLNEHITVLQNPEIIDALDTLSEVSDYSSLKSFVIGLGELHSGIEEVLHPLLMEGSNEITNLINPSKLMAIAEPMQELQQSLSVLDTSNIPIYENLLEMPTERIHSVIQNVSEFKEHLDKCMLAMFPAMHTADSTVEIANKVGALREVCEHLKDIIETTKADEQTAVPEEVKALERTVESLLDATDVSKGIKIDQVKCITEELYEKVGAVQEELIQFTPQAPEKVAQEAKLIQTIDEVQNNIAVLEQYDFVDLSRVSDLTCTSPQMAAEIESDSLMLMEDIVDSAVNVVQDSTQDMPIADQMIVEDFYKTCKSEFTIMRCLLSKATSHKKIIRLLQQFNSLQCTINDFKIKKSELNLTDDVNGCLATFLIHAEDYLQNVQTCLEKIVKSQSNLLIEAPLSKFENSALRLQAVKDTKHDEQIIETVNKFVEILETAKPSLQFVQADILDEIRRPKTDVVEDNTLPNMIEEFATHVEVLKKNNKDIITKEILDKVSNCIEKHNDYKDASGTGKALILLKCLSDCTDILQEGLLEVKIPKHKLEEGPLKAVLTEMLEPLQALHNQLTNVQEQVLKGVDEDSISVDITTTESLVQTMTEKHKEMMERMETEEAIANEEIALIMEVDKKIHSINDSLRSIEGVHVAQVVKEITKPVEDIEKSMHVILSSDKANVYSEDKLPTDVNSNIDSLERAIDRFINIEMDLLVASGTFSDADLNESLTIASELQGLLALNQEELVSPNIIEIKNKKIKSLKAILSKFDWQSTDMFIGKNQLEIENMKQVFLAAYQLLVELEKIDILENKEIKEEKAKQIIQHIDQYIELIEIVEEISAIIKIDDIKETKNIAKELRESITNSEMTAEGEISHEKLTEVRQEQNKLAKKLQTALSALQVQVFERSQELAPELSTEVLQRIAQVTAQLQADLVAVTGIRVAVQAPHESIDESVKAIESVESHSAAITSELATAAARSESTILEQTGVVDQLSSSEQLVVTTEMLYKTIAETKEVVTSEEVKPISVETVTENILPETEQALAVEGMEAVVIEQTESVAIKEVPKEDAKLNVSEGNQVQKITITEPLKTESVSAVIIEDLGPELHEVDENKLADGGPSQTAEIHEAPKATIEMLVQHIDQFISDDLTEVINELSNVIDVHELKQSIGIAKELREKCENIIASEVGLKAETSDVLKDEVNSQYANLAQKLYEALSALENMSLETAAEGTLINKDVLQRVTAVTENLRADLVSVTAIQYILEQTKDAKPDQINSDVAQVKVPEFEAGEVSSIEKEVLSASSEVAAEFILIEEKATTAKGKQLIQETRIQETEKEDNTEIAAPIEINSELNKAIAVTDGEPILVGEAVPSEVEALAVEQAAIIMEEPLEKANTDTPSESLERTLEDVSSKQQTQDKTALVQRINDFISEETSGLVYAITALTNSQELKESIELAKSLKESIEIIQVCEEPGLVENAKVEQAKLAQKLQDALVTLHNKALESAEDISSMSKPDALQKVSEVITHLQEDLEKTIVILPELLQTAEIVEVPDEQNSMKQLEVLLQEVTDKINIPTVREVEDTEALQNALDEVQTVIIKLKCDYDGTANDTLNETLEDLECSVRSVQLQINEDSPPELLKDACAILQLLVNNMSETQEVQAAETVPVEVKNENILEKCSSESNETVELLEQACKVDIRNENLAGIVSSLNILKDTIKTLKLSFGSNAEVLIEKGVDVIQTLDQLEDKVFSLEKELAEVNLSIETRDHILTAVHSVYGSISNMRGTMSSIQKRYMFENYGKPSETLLKSIKNISVILDIGKEDQNNWKLLTKSLRKVLNHFEDIKFYINLDKTARLPSDAAFTKIILEELKSNICEVLVPKASILDEETINKVNNLIECVNKCLTNMESKSTLEVKEKIPVFKQISSEILNVTELIKMKITDISKQSTVQKQEPEPLQQQDISLEKVTQEQEVKNVGTKVKSDVKFDDTSISQANEPTERSHEEQDTVSQTVVEETSAKKAKVRKTVMIQEIDINEIQHIATELVDEIAAQAIIAVQNLEALSMLGEETILPETEVQDVEDEIIQIAESSEMNVEERIAMAESTISIVGADETIAKTDLQDYHTESIEVQEVDKPCTTQDDTKVVAAVLNSDVETDMKSQKYVEDQQESLSSGKVQEMKESEQDLSKKIQKEEGKLSTKDKDMEKLSEEVQCPSTSGTQSSKLSATTKEESKKDEDEIVISQQDKMIQDQIEARLQSVQSFAEIKDADISKDVASQVEIKTEKEQVSHVVKEATEKDKTEPESNQDEPDQGDKNIELVKKTEEKVSETKTEQEIETLTSEAVIESKHKEATKADKAREYEVIGKNTQDTLDAETAELKKNDMEQAVTVEKESMEEKTNVDAEHKQRVDEEKIRSETKLKETKKDNQVELEAEQKAKVDIDVKHDNKEKSLVKVQTEESIEKKETEKLDFTEIPDAEKEPLKASDSSVTTEQKLSVEQQLEEEVKGKVEAEVTQEEKKQEVEKEKITMESRNVQQGEIEKIAKAEDAPKETEKKIKSDTQTLEETLEVKEKQTDAEKQEITQECSAFKVDKIEEDDNAKTDAENQQKDEDIKLNLEKVQKEANKQRKEEEETQFDAETSKLEEEDQSAKLETEKKLRDDETDKNAMLDAEKIQRKAGKAEKKRKEEEESIKLEEQNKQEKEKKTKDEEDKIKLEEQKQEQDKIAAKLEADSERKDEEKLEEQKTQEDETLKVGAEKEQTDREQAVKFEKENKLKDEEEKLRLEADSNKEHKINEKQEVEAKIKIEEDKKQEKHEEKLAAEKRQKGEEELQTKRNLEMEKTTKDEEEEQSTVEAEKKQKKEEKKQNKGDKRQKDKVEEQASFEADKKQKEEEAKIEEEKKSKDEQTKVEINNKRKKEEDKTKLEAEIEVMNDEVNRRKEKEDDKTNLEAEPESIQKEKNTQLETEKKSKEEEEEEERKSKLEEEKKRKEEEEDQKKVEKKRLEDDKKVKLEADDKLKEEDEKAKLVADTKRKEEEEKAKLEGGMKHEEEQEGATENKRKEEEKLERLEAERKQEEEHFKSEAESKRKEEEEKAKFEAENKLKDDEKKQKKAEKKRKEEEETAKLQAENILKEEEEKAKLEAENKRKDEETKLKKAEKKRKDEEKVKLEAEQKLEDEEEKSILEADNKHNEGEQRDKVETENKRKEEEVKAKLEAENKRTKEQKKQQKAEKKRKEEEKAKLEAEQKQKEEEEKAKLEAENKHKEEEERAKLEAENKRKEEEERAKLEAEKKRKDEEEKAKEDAENKRKDEEKKQKKAEKKRKEEETAKLEAKQKQKEEAEKVKLEAEKKRKEQEENSKLEAENKRKEEEEKAKLEAEKKRKDEEEKAKEDAENKRKDEEKKQKKAEKKRKEEETAKLEAKQKQKEEAEKVKLEAEKKRKEQEENSKLEAENKRKEEEEKAKLEAEKKRKDEEEKTNLDAENKRKDEENKQRKAEKKRKEEEKAKLEAEQKQKEEAEKAKLEAENKRKGQEENAKLEVENKRKEEEEKAKLEAAKKRKEEEEKAKLDAENKSKDDEIKQRTAEKKRKEEEKAKLEAEQKQKEEAEKANLEAENKRKEQEDNANLEAENKRKEEEEKAKQDAENKRKDEEKKQKKSEKKRKEEEKAKLEAEQKQKEEAEKAKLEAENKRNEEEEKAKLEAEKKRIEEENKQRKAEEKRKEEEKAKLEAEQKQKEEAEKAKLEAENKRNEEEEKAKLEAEKKRIEEEEKAKLAAENKRKDKENKQRKAEEKRKEEEKAKLEAEQKQKEEAEKAKLEAENKRKEQEENAKLEAENKRKEEEEKAKLEAAKKRKEEEEKAKLDAENKSKDDENKERKAEKKRKEEEKAKLEAEQKQKEEAEKANLEAENKRKEQEDNANLEAENKRKEEEEKAKQDAENKRKDEEKKQKKSEKKRKEEEKAKLEAEQKQKEEAEKAKLEAENKRNEEEEKAKLEAEKKRIEEEEKAKLAAENKRKDKENKQRKAEEKRKEEEKAKLEAEQKQKEEAEKANLEAENKRKEQEDNANLEAENKRMEEEEKAKQDAENKRKDEEKKQKKAEKKRKEEEKAKLEAEQKQKEEEEKAKLEAEKKRKEEEEKAKQDAENKRKDEEKKQKKAEKKLKEEEKANLEAEQKQKEEEDKIENKRKAEEKTKLEGEQKQKEEEEKAEKKRKEEEKAKLEAESKLKDEETKQKKAEKKRKEDKEKSKLEADKKCKEEEERSKIETEKKEKDEHRKLEDEKKRKEKLEQEEKHQNETQSEKLQKTTENKRKQEEKEKQEQEAKAQKEKEETERKRKEAERLKEKEILEAKEEISKHDEEIKRESEKKRIEKLEKENEEQKIREDEEKVRLEKKRISKKKREDEDSRLKQQAEETEKARKETARKRKDEEKLRLAKEQEEHEKHEQEIRETERRIREERRREIEKDLIDTKQKPSTSELEASSESRPRNGDISIKRGNDEDHYIKEYHYEPTKERSQDRAKFVDHNHKDYTMEFIRPSGYREKTFEHERFLERESLGKTATIYKAQTIILDSQLRSSVPPLPERSESERRERFDRGESERRVDRHRSKALSEARSLISEKRSSLSRDLKRKPVFSTYLTDRTAVEGSRVKLTCSVLSSSDPKITWYRNGVLLDNKLKYKTKYIDGLITLEVLNAVVSDSAEYSCTVENENGSVNTAANLKVYPSFEASPIPPTFTRSIRDTYHLAENELVLECRIRGQPLPTITWLKDDRPVSTNERYQAYYLADGVCRLAISSPTPEDNGKYTCKAENSVWSDQITHVVNFTGKESCLSPNIATIERSRFNRQAMESRRPHFTNVLSDYKVAKGGTIGLQVEIRGCPTRVEWLREGRCVTEVYRNARTFVEQGLYTLALSDVTEKESGMYTCRAWSTHGNVDMNAAITVVANELEGKPAIIAGRPDKDILISVGEDINISFRVQGEPKPKVVFMKGIRDITTSQRVCKMTSDDYVKFTLKRSVVSDAGTYCILARNAYGCDRAFVTVVVRQRASSDNLISDWTYPMDDAAVSVAERKYKSVPDRIPGEPSVVDGGNNWVSLAWPKADPRDTAPVLAYKIESWLLGKEGGARWVELGITPLNSFDAFNLKQGEEYHFRVTPKNRYGWGESVQTLAPVGIGLAGDRPEFVDILPGQLKVLAGETANLSCSVKGKPLPEIVWMKNGHEIEEESRVTTLYNGQDCSLNIKDICIEDEARYSCEASNVHGRASTYARLAVVTDRLIWEADAKLKRERSQDAEGDYPPQFTMRLRDRRVQATYPVRLTCQVVGNPPPTLTWFKDGELLVFDSRRTNYQDEHFHTLEIAPTTLEDGGVYEAMARNSSGAVSCRCSLVVDKGIRAYVAPEFCCGLEPLYRLSEGEELRISAVVEAYPSVGVTWYRDGVRLRPSRRAIMTLDRDGQIELALAAVTGRDAGVYTCTASNEVGRASTSGKVEVIEGDQPREKRTPPVVINAPDEPYSKEPMFIRKPRSSEAREGDTVIIACEVIGDPKPDVYWLRDFLKPDYYRDATHFKRVGDGPEYRFEIPHAKLDYTGAYSVVARNVHGEAKAIISLQILAKDPSSTDDSHNVRYGRVDVIPRFERELTDLLSYDGDAVEFECHVSGNPEPDIRWFHYNELIRDCPDFESTFEEGAARLKIKQVTAEDEGTYSCEAANNLGKATSSACLVVYPPGEPNTLSQRLRRPPALLSAASTPRSTPRSTPARSVSRTPGPDARRLCSPSRQMAPSFYTYPFNKVVEEGDHVTFKCAVKGQPSPWTTWDKDGIIITPSARITMREKDDMLRILEIEQVSIEDVGIYRITIENEFGRAEATARLEVITQKGKFYGGVRAYSASPRKSLTYRRYPSVPRQD